MAIQKAPFAKIRRAAVSAFALLATAALSGSWDVPGCPLHALLAAAVRGALRTSPSPLAAVWYLLTERAFSDPWLMTLAIHALRSLWPWIEMLARAVA